ncbi:MAG TPA: DNA polymerase III subunit gamma/tau [Bacteroidales bacterium]|nr:DNA polymerase III subunit gamma/tau [Bacteroidales bacterium]
MENFIVSARKYRPQTFESVIGQKHITGTLKNAIRNRQLAQAFLFCGPRGVGKTTCARIFAKVINCQNPGENMEPCNQCESCTSFNNNASFNIHELDAASNNSVDDIRNLVDQVRIPPQVGAYKVYIIDEVHMLSQAAFNAFLKTLEEPPPYAKFILATTEKHKIIPTILSRCQIFDFKRITLHDIASYLAWIAEKEQVTAEPEALHIIAQKADGAMRDALSIFDQLVSYSGNSITYQTVIDNLNVLDYDYYFRLTDLLLNHDVKAALLVLDEIITRGFEGQHFLLGFGSHLRNLLVSRDPVTLPLLEESEIIAGRYQAQGTRCSEFFLIEALKKHSYADTQYKLSNNKRLLLELLLIETALLGVTPANSPAVSNPPPPSTTDVQKKKDLNPKVTTPIAAPPESAAQPLGTSALARCPAEAEKQETPISKPKTIPQPNGNDKKRKMPNGRIRNGESISVTKAAESELQRNRRERSLRESVKEQAEPLLEATVHKFWETFAQPFSETNPILFSSLTAYPTQVVDNDTILLRLDNKLQENIIFRNQAELLDYLRFNLHNNNIRLQIQLSDEKREIKPYTAKDRFLEMAKKNPDLIALQKRLGLTLDDY